MRKWCIDDSAELYNINGWGINYFSINEKGNISVTPKKKGAAVDLRELVDELQVRDVSAPMLVRFTDSTVPLADSFTTALSMVAMWMLARKWVEQWLAWLVVDAVCAVLYFYKSIPFTASLYAFYTVMAVVGYRAWHRRVEKS